MTASLADLNESVLSRIRLISEPERTRSLPNRLDHKVLAATSKRAGNTGLNEGLEQGLERGLEQGLAPGLGARAWRQGATKAKRTRYAGTLNIVSKSFRSGWPTS